MKTYSKRIKIAREKITEETYSAQSAISVLKQISPANFIESVEAHICLNIDPKYADQQLRTTVVLPNGSGKSIKIAVLAPEDKHTEAKENGADIVGSTELIDDIKKGNINFDLLIATPDMMPKIAALGKVLGPKGLMPSPKGGTVSTDLTTTLTEFKKGKLEYRADRTGIVHISFGKIDFSEDDLLENLLALYNSIEQNKPAGVKGKYFKSFYIAKTMSPSVRIDLDTLT
jgi:large subunit ribosomal protein L1